MVQNPRILCVTHFLIMSGDRVLSPLGFRAFRKGCSTSPKARSWPKVWKAYETEEGLFFLLLLGT